MVLDFLLSLPLSRGQYRKTNAAVKQGLVKQVDPGVSPTRMRKEFWYWIVETHAKHTKIMFCNGALGAFIFLFHYASFAISDIQKHSLMVTFAWKLLFSIVI